MAAPNDTLTIVTQAMRLSPPEPSFLDMRNAILQADTARFDGAHHATIWSVFARRGMGWDASTVDGADTAAGRGLGAAARGRAGRHAQRRGHRRRHAGRRRHREHRHADRHDRRQRELHAHEPAGADLRPRGDRGPGLSTASCSTTWRCPAQPTPSCAATGPPCAAARPRPRRPATRTRRSAAARSRPSTGSRAARGRRSRERTSRWWSGSRRRSTSPASASTRPPGCGDGVRVVDGAVHRRGRGRAPTGPWTQIAAGTFDRGASLQLNPSRDGERRGLRPAHADDHAGAGAVVHRRVGVLRLRRRRASRRRSSRARRRRGRRDLHVHRDVGVDRVRVLAGRRGRSTTCDSPMRTGCPSGRAAPVRALRGVGTAPTRTPVAARTSRSTHSCRRRR